MTPRHFAWQAWHNCGTLRGRRDAISHASWVPVAGVAQDDVFAWQAWLSSALGLDLVARDACDAATLCEAWHNLPSAFVFAWQDIRVLHFRL